MFKDMTRPRSPFAHPVRLLPILLLLLSACTESTVFPSGKYDPVSIHTEILFSNSSDGSNELSITLKDGATTDAAYLRVSDSDTILATQSGVVPNDISISDNFFNNGKTLSEQLNTFKVRGLYVSKACNFPFLNCMFNLVYKLLPIFPTPNDNGNGNNGDIYTGTPVYYTNFEPLNNNQVDLAFMRKNHLKASALLTLPQAPSIDKPAENELVNRSADINVSWLPSGLSDTIKIVVHSLSCNQVSEPLSFAVSGDPGTYTIPASALSGLIPSGSGNCNLGIEVLRSRTEQVDGFANSSVATAMQSDMHTVVWGQ